MGIGTEGVVGASALLSAPAQTRQSACVSRPGAHADHASTAKDAFLQSPMTISHPHHSPPLRASARRLYHTDGHVKEGGSADRTWRSGQGGKFSRARGPATLVAALRRLL